MTPFSKAGRVIDTTHGMISSKPFRILNALSNLMRIMVELMRHSLALYAESLVELHGTLGEWWATGEQSAGERNTSGKPRNIRHRLRIALRHSCTLS